MAGIRHETRGTGSRKRSNPQPTSATLRCAAAAAFPSSPAKTYVMRGHTCRTLRPYIRRHRCHVCKVYEKLGVHSMLEARQRLEDLELLESAAGWSKCLPYRWPTLKCHCNSCISCPKRDDRQWYWHPAADRSARVRGPGCAARCCRWPSGGQGSRLHGARPGTAGQRSP